jgi:hypothetical protein
LWVPAGLAWKIQETARIKPSTPEHPGVLNFDEVGVSFKDAAFSVCSASNLSIVEKDA